MNFFCKTINLFFGLLLYSSIFAQFANADYQEAWGQPSFGNYGQPAMNSFPDFQNQPFGGSSWDDQGDPFNSADMFSNFNFAETISNLSPQDIEEAVQYTKAMAGGAIDENEIRESLLTFKDQCNDPAARDQINSSMREMFANGGADLFAPPAGDGSNFNNNTDNMPTNFDENHSLPEDAWVDPFSSAHLDKLTENIDEKEISLIKDEVTLEEKKVVPANLEQMFKECFAPLTKEQKKFYREGVLTFLENMKGMVSQLYTPLLASKHDLKSLPEKLERFARNLAFFSRSFELRILFSENKSSKKTDELKNQTKSKDESLKKNENEILQKRETIALALKEISNLQKQLNKESGSSISNAIDAPVKGLLKNFSKKQKKISLTPMLERQCEKTLKAIDVTELFIGNVKGSLKEEAKKKKQKVKTSLGLIAHKFPTEFRNSLSPSNNNRYNSNHYNPDSGWGRWPHKNDSTGTAFSQPAKEDTILAKDENPQVKQNDVAPFDYEYNPSESLNEFLESQTYKALASLDDNIESMNEKTLEQLTEVFLRTDFEKLKKRVQNILKQGSSKKQFDEGAKSDGQAVSKVDEKSKDKFDFNSSPTEKDLKNIKESLKKILRPISLLIAHPQETSLIDSSSNDEKSGLLLPFHHKFANKYSLAESLASLSQSSSNVSRDDLAKNLFLASKETLTIHESLKKLKEIDILQLPDSIEIPLLEKFEKLRTQVIDSYKNTFLGLVKNICRDSSLTQNAQSFILNQSVLSSLDISGQLNKCVDLLYNLYYFVPVAPMIMKDALVSESLTELLDKYSSQFKIHVEYFLGSSSAVTENARKLHKTFSAEDLKNGFSSLEIHTILSSFDAFVKAMNLPIEKKSSFKSNLQNNIGAINLLTDHVKRDVKDESFSNLTEVLSNFKFMQHFNLEALNIAQLGMQTAQQALIWIPLYAHKLISINQEMPKEAVNGLFLTYEKLTSYSQSNPFFPIVNAMHFDYINAIKDPSRSLTDPNYTKYALYLICALSVMCQAQAQSNNEKWEVITNEVFLQFFNQSNDEGKVNKSLDYLFVKMINLYSRVYFDYSLADVVIPSLITDKMHSLISILNKLVYLFVFEKLVPSQEKIKDVCAEIEFSIKTGIQSKSVLEKRIFEFAQTISIEALKVESDSTSEVSSGDNLLEQIISLYLKVFSYTKLDEGRESIEDEEDILNDESIVLDKESSFWHSLKIFRQFYQTLRLLNEVQKASFEEILSTSAEGTDLTVVTNSLKLLQDKCFSLLEDSPDDVAVSKIKQLLTDWLDIIDFSEPASEPESTE